jgi:hypothetical protein
LNCSWTAARLRSSRTPDGRPVSTLTRHCRSRLRATRLPELLPFATSANSDLLPRVCPQNRVPSRSRFARASPLRHDRDRCSVLSRTAGQLTGQARQYKRGRDRGLEDGGHPPPISLSSGRSRRFSFRASVCTVASRGSSNVSRNPFCVSRSTMRSRESCRVGLVDPRTWRSLSSLRHPYARQHGCH